MIKNQDCLEYLETLENESVDMILTDPPYFIGFDGGKGWDSQWKSENEYLDWGTMGYGMGGYGEGFY